jgi:hypothetical protein
LKLKRKKERKKERNKTMFTIIHLVTTTKVHIKKILVTKGPFTTRVGK